MYFLLTFLSETLKLSLFALYLAFKKIVTQEHFLLLLERKEKREMGEREKYRREKERETSM